MDRYPRTHLGALLAIAMLFALASVPVAAQARNTETSSGQAVLHIRINIVPVLIAPPPPADPNKPLASTISYSVPTSSSNVEVILETRPLPVPSAGGATGPQGAILQTRTIVSR